MADYFLPVSAGVNAAGGLISGALNHMYDLEMAEKSYELNEKAAKNADTRTRKLYNDFYSIEAQINQLKKAGLNPNLMYSEGAGSVGQSTPTGAQAAPAHVANTAHFDLQTDLANLALVKSQTQLNEANANKANEEANKTKTLTPLQADLIGAETEEKRANIQKLGVETQAIELANAWQECENKVKEATIDTAIEIANEQLNNVKAKTEELLAAAEKSQAETKTINQSRKWIIKQYRENVRKTMEEVTLIYAEEELKHALTSKYGADTEKVNAEKDKILEETAYIEKKYLLDVERYGLEKARTENENHYRNALIALGWTKTAVDSIMKIVQSAGGIAMLAKGHPAAIGFGAK